VPYIPGCPICPTTALRALVTTCPAAEDAPLFSFKKDEWITYKDFLQFIKIMAVKLDLDPKAFGCHSLRSGGATFASEAGVNGQLIKEQGLWLSDAYLLYIHTSEETRWSLPATMGQKILFLSP
jgi:hypothetical protein